MLGLVYYQSLQPAYLRGFDGETFCADGGSPESIGDVGRSLGRWRQAARLLESKRLYMKAKGTVVHCSLILPEDVEGLPLHKTIPAQTKGWEEEVSGR